MLRILHEDSGHGKAVRSGTANMQDRPIFLSCSLGKASLTHESESLDGQMLGPIVPGGNFRSRNPMFATCLPFAYRMARFLARADDEEDRAAA